MDITFVIDDDDYLTIYHDGKIVERQFLPEACKNLPPPAPLEPWQAQLLDKGIEVSSDEVVIDDLDFIGFFSRSHNERYLLSWSDDGRYLLLDHDEIVVRGRNGQPEDGSVADNGTFVLTDWEDGSVSVFSALGERVLRKSIGSIGVSAISPSGRWIVASGSIENDALSDELSDLIDIGSAEEALAALLTLQDGDGLWLFDLHENRTHSPIKLLRRSVRSLAIEDQLETITVVFDDEVRHVYSFDGILRDPEMLLPNLIELANGYQLVNVAVSQSKKINSDDLHCYSEVIRLLQKGLEKGLSAPTQAIAEKLLGEIHLRCRHDQQALQHFEKALRLKPNIGIKRLVDRLRTDVQ